MEYSKPDKLFSNLPEAAQAPGFSVLAMRGNETLYERQFGYASLEYGLPITDSTVFHVASVSKQFTALCATLLEETGRIDLDASVRRYFPELPACMEPVHLRHLIHHTGGMREQWDLFTLSGSSMEDLATPGQTLRALQRQTRLNFVPGERYQYCNSGYILLAQLVERVTGQTLRQFAQEHVFGPLGMSSTYFRDDHGEICHDRAESYEWEGGAYKHRALTFDVAGNTSLNTTPHDLCRWLAELMHPQVFSPAVIVRMKEPFTLNSGSVSDYCRGIRHTCWHGTDLYYHTGANAGFRAVTMAAPALDLRIVVLSNYGASRPYPSALRLLELLAPEVFQAEPESKYRSCDELSPSEGLLLCGMNRAELTREMCGLRLRLPGADWPFFHAGGNEYVSAAMDAHLYLQPDGAAVLEGFGGTAETYRRAVFVSVPECERRMAGMYLSVELLTFYRLFFEGETLVLEHLKHGTQQFRRQPGGTYVSITGDAMTLHLLTGTNPGFVIDKERSQHMLFTKTGAAE